MSRALAPNPCHRRDVQGGCSDGGGQADCLGWASEPGHSGKNHEGGRPRTYSQNPSGSRRAGGHRGAGRERPEPAGAAQRGWEVRRGQVATGPSWALEGPAHPEASGSGSGKARPRGGTEAGGRAASAGTPAGLTDQLEEPRPCGPQTQASSPPRGVKCDSCPWLLETQRVEGKTPCLEVQGEHQSPRKPSSAHGLPGPRCGHTGLCVRAQKTQRTQFMDPPSP